MSEQRRTARAGISWSNYKGSRDATAEPSDPVACTALSLLHFTKMATAATAGPSGSTFQHKEVPVYCQLPGKEVCHDAHFPILPHMHAAPAYFAA